MIPNYQRIRDALSKWIRSGPDPIQIRDPYLFRIRSSVQVDSDPGPLYRSVPKPLLHPNQICQSVCYLGFNTTSTPYLSISSAFAIATSLIAASFDLNLGLMFPTV